MMVTIGIVGLVNGFEKNGMIATNGSDKAGVQQIATEM